jgi:hypothetical protein
MGFNTHLSVIALTTVSPHYFFFGHDLTDMTLTVNSGFVIHSRSDRVARVPWFCMHVPIWFGLATLVPSPDLVWSCDLTHFVLVHNALFVPINRHRPVI